MQLRGHQVLIVLAAVLSLQHVGTALAQAPKYPATIWRFMGIPQGYNKIVDARTNRFGNFPGLERKPPLKGLADPENLKSTNPAIKAAAQIKQEEDLAAQKIKALKYLATVGCGCYPGVKEALMAALDDCTESVRFQAAQSIGEAAAKHCNNCKTNCCCDPEMSKKLSEVAYERNDRCCFVEPSERVRQAAAEALRACCPGGPRMEEVSTPEPTVTPPGETTTPEGEQTPTTVPPVKPAPVQPPPMTLYPAQKKPAVAKASPNTPRQAAKPFLGNVNTTEPKVASVSRPSKLLPIPLSQSKDMEPVQVQIPVPPQPRAQAQRAVQAMRQAQATETDTNSKRLERLLAPTSSPEIPITSVAKKAPQPRGSRPVKNAKQPPARLAVVASAHAAEVNNGLVFISDSPYCSPAPNRSLDDVTPPVPSRGAASLVRYAQREPEALVSNQVRTQPATIKPRVEAPRASRSTASGENRTRAEDAQAYRPAPLADRLIR